MSVKNSSHPGTYQETLSECLSHYIFCEWNYHDIWPDQTLHSGGEQKQEVRQSKSWRMMSLSWRMMCIELMNSVTSLTSSENRRKDAKPRLQVKHGFTILSRQIHFLHPIILTFYIFVLWENQLVGPPKKFKIVFILSSWFVITLIVDSVLPKPA